MSAVLVTGGTGTFGEAFVKATLAAGIQRVCVFSRGEHRQAEMRAAVDDARVRWFIGDVRDQDRLTRAMNGVDWVVHAAALKRIEVCEYDPDEVVKTNVNGALNVIAAATAAGVKKVVALSTDKACDPLNAYGASKLLAEKVFLAANNARGRDGPRFAVTRYGNIAGSAGSVIPKWRALLAAGAKAVPVTDPHATRFWMTIDEAVRLVADTLENMKGGELVIPDWLPAYRVADLAAAMGAKMEITGLPAFEKRHEAMSPGLTSDCAPKLSVAELRQRLEALP